MANIKSHQTRVSVLHMYMHIQHVHIKDIVDMTIDAVLIFILFTLFF